MTGQLWSSETRFVGAVLWLGLLLALPSCRAQKTAWDPEYRGILGCSLQEAADKVPSETLTGQADGKSFELKLSEPSWVTDLCEWRQLVEGTRFTEETTGVRWNEVALGIVVECFRYGHNGGRRRVTALQVIIQGQQGRMRGVARQLRADDQGVAWNATLTSDDVSLVYEYLKLIRGIDVRDKSYCHQPKASGMVFGYTVGLITVIQGGQGRQFLHCEPQVSEEQGGPWVEDKPHGDLEMTGRFWSLLLELQGRVRVRVTKGIPE